MLLQAVTNSGQPVQPLPQEKESGVITSVAYKALELIQTLFSSLVSLALAPYYFIVNLTNFGNDDIPSQPKLDGIKDPAHSKLVQTLIDNKKTIFVVTGLALGIIATAYAANYYMTTHGITLQSLWKSYFPEAPASSDASGSPESDTSTSFLGSTPNQEANAPLVLVKENNPFPQMGTFNSLTSNTPSSTGTDPFFVPNWFRQQFTTEQPDPTLLDKIVTAFSPKNIDPVSLYVLGSTLAVIFIGSYCLCSRKNKPEQNPRAQEGSGANPSGTLQPTTGPTPPPAPALPIEQPDQPEGAEPSDLDVTGIDAKKLSARWLPKTPIATSKAAVAPSASSGPATSTDLSTLISKRRNSLKPTDTALKPASPATLKPVLKATPKPTGTNKPTRTPITPVPPQAAAAAQPKPVVNKTPDLVQPDETPPKRTPPVPTKAAAASASLSHLPPQTRDSSDLKRLVGRTYGTDLTTVEGEYATADAIAKRTEMQRERILKLVEEKKNLAIARGEDPDEITEESVRQELESNRLTTGSLTRRAKACLGDEDVEAEEHEKQKAAQQNKALGSKNIGRRRNAQRPSAVTSVFSRGDNEPPDAPAPAPPPPPTIPSANPLTPLTSPTAGSSPSSSLMAELQGERKLKHVERPSAASSDVSSPTGINSDMLERARIQHADSVEASDSDFPDD